MVEFLKTLAIACIPAIITGIVTYIVARKNAASQISIIKEQNKHDLEKLMHLVLRSDSNYTEKVMWKRRIVFQQNI